MKTTRILLVAMISALMFGSCVKENQTDKTEDLAGRPISVSIAGGNAQSTRGVPTTTENIITDVVVDYKLWVFQNKSSKYSTVGTLSAGVNVTPGGSTKELTGHYWPVPAPTNLTYYAVHPASAVVAETKPTVAGENHPTMAVKYTVSGTMSAQTDLLIAYGTATTNPLPIHFQHALTRVTFQGQISANDVGLTDVKITGIVIKNVRTTETLTFNSYTLDGDKYISSWTGGGTWTVTGPTNGIFTATSLTTNNTITIDAQAAGTYIGYAAGNDSFFVMPMTGVDALKDVKLDVTMTWKHSDGSDGGNTFDDLDLPIDDVSAWEIGKHINYVLKFNANNLRTPLSVSSVTVQPWGTDGEPDDTGTVPIN